MQFLERTVNVRRQHRGRQGKQAPGQQEQEQGIDQREHDAPPRLGQAPQRAGQRFQGRGQTPRRNPGLDHRTVKSRQVQSGLGQGVGQRLAAGDPLRELLGEPAQAARQVFAQGPQTAIQRHTRAHQGRDFIVQRDELIEGDDRFG